MTRNCFNCTYFTELIDDYQCWAFGEPESTDIREDCEGWEVMGDKVKVTIEEI